jgi:hypothetical protein
VHFLSFPDCLRSYLLELGTFSYVRIFELLSRVSYCDILGVGFGDLSNVTLVIVRF